EAVQALRKYLSGPPSPQSPNGPVQLTKQFQSVQELSLVPEFIRITENQPDWENYFTIWGDGKIDVNLANASTIELITGVTSAQADQFVKYRWGPDKKPDTDDDIQYQSMDQVRAALGLSTGQFELVQDLLSLNSAVDRVDSTGTIAGYSKTVTVITNRGAAQPRILSWQEK
ncbi:MAG: hypothetical protein JO076_06295, partial [Verrucomicrobia bacterium]|nr:hypothetical protein [Verrucomicrobiota bacterium]